MSEDAGTEPLELLEMEAAEAGELAAPGRVSRRRTTRWSSAIALPAHEAGLRGPVDEPAALWWRSSSASATSPTVGPRAVGVAPHREEQLVLRRR